MEVVDRLNKTEQDTLENLKDFQKATVERIASLYEAGQNRVLLADEVGLGKTLVARGVIAKLAKYRLTEEHDDLFKIIYICSNQSIAQQNIKKLNIFNLENDLSQDTRLSMQHLHITKQEIEIRKANSGVPIQLIGLTPETSFHLSTGNGNVNERALMFAILRRLDELQGIREEELSELLRANVNVENWNRWKSEYEQKVLECENDPSNYKKYPENLIEKIREYNETYHTIDRLLLYLDRKQDGNGCDFTDKELIGDLRTMFAVISVEMLEPDFVIMDEFQRFKFLLDEEGTDSETGLLVKKFLNRHDLRMLLLSATPYKLYSTLDEIEDSNIDEHYSEFFRVMTFLLSEDKKITDFKNVWSNYSMALHELKKDNTAILCLKKQAEEAMYQAVCRTERIAVMESGDYTDIIRMQLQVGENDILSYLAMGQLLKEIGADFSLPIDYVKSCPYLMSFMLKYKVKEKIEIYFANNTDEIDKANHELLWLNRRALENYEKLPETNARLEALKNSIFQNNSELFLWVPPSKPYYELSGVYKNSEGFSKILVFSAWEMVPRMIGCMVSYEAERLTIGKMKQLTSNSEIKNSKYFDKNRYSSGRLSFRDVNDRAYSMSLLTMFYPSKYLAELYDPIDCLNKKMNLAAIERDVAVALRIDIKRVQDEYQAMNSGNEDSRWYYMMPALLDKEYAQNWINGVRTVADQDGLPEGFFKSIDKMEEYLQAGKELKLGKMPDDLVVTLINVVLGSPAVCIYRSIKNSPLHATQLSGVFQRRFNSSEATAIVDLAYAGQKDESTYWKSVLRYCKEGNFQAMFDEYVHILREEVSFGSNSDKNEEIYEIMGNSLQLHTATYSIDTFRKFKKDLLGEESKTEEEKSMLRSHFAVGFMKGEGNEDKNLSRKESLRNAFNSPMRPFVLATTSIGQEGLDFHNYCRKVMHWNLPANPIDLEQREGRVNRFKCLAIRQDIAKKHGNITFEKDVWQEMFAEATKLKDATMSDLVPYWCTGKNQEVKIERLLPLYAFSKDEEKYARLIKILSLYRLTLGQPRQEELLEYVFSEFDEQEQAKLKELFINLSPYFRKQN